jgi:hypothetical protein
MLLTHRACNAYCTGDLHCDLVYVGKEALWGRPLPASDAELCAAIGRELPGAVRIEPAREAPPLGVSYTATDVGPGLDHARYLVWYRQED